ncbi:LacI family transcriptional regulator [Rhodonellum psychrophilum GCM71 = DSM 17998]|uniref:LacI family transcriptional regulator n=2 Tax=Rhodonellum TaxID=336827 RepID=U5C3I8_9BACT|nr:MULTISPECIES: LacI family DNA-binding transcriptional regulator [Rhodonellum]ERM82767.1 LacI family transcriptional regulator [Rhodonellum psychrophilum GCM71 = DSM 17998]MDO9554481.1 LacI family DNA-binding transcriptional regulator [Rhodonellum sp.]SDZ28421.1 transcriptional regulator, LacI family [Rhodonellum ikkaensis]
MKKGKSTIHDIAEKLGITASTVSRALNDHPRISENTKKLVIKMARQLNYQPNNIASALRSGKSKLIGVVVPTVNRNFFSSVIRGIEDIANTLDYKVIISQSYEDYEKEVQTVEALLNARVDGIIASIAKNTEKFDHFQKVLDKGIPLVLFDRITNSLEVSQVVIDDHYGAYQTVDHLIQQGCKRIVHFTSPKKINIYKERLRGYMDALQDHSIPFDPLLIEESNMQLEDGRQSMLNILEKNIPFDAVFSSSDYAAMGAMQVLKERGFKIPEQVMMAGFGNEPFTSFTDPPLTTVDQKSIPMGKETAETFFELLKSDQKKDSPQKTVLKPELIIRRSSQKK